MIIYQASPQLPSCSSRLTLNLLSPGGGLSLLTAPKRMLRSIRNILTFPKFQKQKKIEKFEFHFFNPTPPGGGCKKIGK